MSRNVNKQNDSIFSLFSSVLKCYIHHMRSLGFDRIESNASAIIAAKPGGRMKKVHGSGEEEISAALVTEEKNKKKTASMMTENSFFPSSVRFSCCCTNYS
jgi:hypothetical protein